MLLEDFQYMVIAYDDWFVPELAPFVLEAVNEFADWEHEAIIAAEAVYAASFLSVN